MTEIDELQRRIAAALDRVATGIDRLGPSAGDADLAALGAALENERQVNAQLEDQMRAVAQKQDRQVAELREQVAAGREALAQLDGELGRLKRANDALVATNAQLAQSDGTDPGLVDRALRAELEAIRAARATDRAESAALLAALEPLLAEAGQGGDRAGDHWDDRDTEERA